MLLPVLLATLAQGATPSSTVVIVTRRTAVSTADAQALAVLVTKRLEAAGVEVVRADVAAKRLASLGVADTSTCAGRLACVQEFGRQLGVAAVTGLSVSEVDQDRSLSLEVVRVADGTRLAREDLLFARRAAPQVEQLDAFAKRTLAALPARASVAVAPPPAPGPVVAAPPPEPAPVVVAPPPQPEPGASTDTPVASVLSPTPAQPPAELSAPPPPGPSRSARWVAGGGTVLAVAAAVTLAVLAFSAKAELSRGDRTEQGFTRSLLTGRQAQEVSARANAEFAGAGICGGIGVGLGVATAVLW